MKRIAVLVGIEQYESYGLLDYAADDARRLATSLKRWGYQTTLFQHDAPDGPVRRRQVIEGVRQAISQCGPEDTFLLFFAGHGSRKNEQDYLLFSDTNPDNLRATALPVASTDPRATTLESLLRPCQAKQVIFLIDACRASTNRSGRAGFSGGRLDSGFKERLARVIRTSAPQARSAVLYACSPGQTAKEQRGGGVFTDALIAALSTIRHALSMGEMTKVAQARIPKDLPSPQTPTLVGDPNLMITGNTPTVAAAPLPTIGTLRESPDSAPVTRYALAQIIFGEFYQGMALSTEQLLLQRNVCQDAGSDEPLYPDVPVRSAAYPAVQYLTWKKILLGNDNLTFRGEASVTRYEAAMVIIRLAGERNLVDRDYHKWPKSSPFRDISQEHWAWTSVALLAKLGIADGIATGKFNGNRPMVLRELRLWITNLKKITGGGHSG